MKDLKIEFFGDVYGAMGSTLTMSDLPLRGR